MGCLGFSEDFALPSPSLSVEGEGLGSSLNFGVCFGLGVMALVRLRLLEGREAVVSLAALDFLSWWEAAFVCSSSVDRGRCGGIADAASRSGAGR